ncbi:hypothetical protein [Streptomyces sp. NPDC002386]
MIDATTSVDQSIEARIRSVGVNRFIATPAFFRTRRKRVDEVASALLAIEHGMPLTKKVVSSRYTAGLPSVAPHARAQLYDWLQRFQCSAAAIRTSEAQVCSSGRTESNKSEPSPAVS